MAQAGRIAGAAKMMPFITGLTVFFLILFVLVTGLRLYARIRLLRIGFRWDDGKCWQGEMGSVTRSGGMMITDANRGSHFGRVSMCINGTKSSSS